MSKKRQPAKVSSQPAGKMVKLNITLPADLAKRLGVHAEMVELSKSELIAELVRAGCRRFVVSDRQVKEGDPLAEIETDAA